MTVQSSCTQNNMWIRSPSVLYNLHHLKIHAPAHCAARLNSVSCRGPCAQCNDTTPSLVFHTARCHLRSCKNMLYQKANILVHDVTLHDEVLSGSAFNSISLMTVLTILSTFCNVFSHVSSLASALLLAAGGTPSNQSPREFATRHQHSTRFPIY